MRATVSMFLMVCLAGTASTAARAAEVTARLDLEVYGRMDLAITDSDAGLATHNGVAGVSLENNFSLIGVRGGEAIGGGWEFFFQVELGVEGADDDNGREPFGTRPTFIGLAGPVGHVQVGKMDPVLKTTKGFADAFDNYSTKHDRLLAGEIPHGDSVEYWTPVWNGLSAGGTLLLEDEYHAGDEARQDRGNYQVSLRYGDRTLRDGPLYLGIAYGDGIEDIEAVRVVGQYRLGPWKIGGMYQDTRRVAPDAPDDVIAGDRRDGRGWLVSVIHERGPWRLKVQGGRDDSGNGFIARRLYGRVADGEAALDGVPEITALAAGFEYYFVPRLRLHGEWGRWDIDNVRELDSETVVSMALRYEY